MTATTIKQTEGEPADYPDAPSGLSTAATALDPDMIWQRIEAYTAWRYTSRSIEWIVEGCGEWHAPLAPATISTVDIWQADAWQTATLSPSPVGGYCLPGGTYRFTGTVGSGTPPAAVLEAFRRLAEYMAASKRGSPGTTREKVVAGSVQVDKSRSASWAAEAMANSGAGDLLRSFRRV
ncbi:hypothetical protein [Mesorhizobium sp. M7A.F.Ca.ET.027.03.2.1]|uniref:hypothetical protein n=1 Tax=Mesorhizobium sp. M7A.F.Ca.ET.027.03.2.1 TaxID=2496656 RepID=UPI000FCC7D8B|nr:hypothetical protein [Mesorhizobium sp. M7A.F.Ca.ET.027.03.2.1]RVD61141.1 hypothetical protein EN750_22890 [Mesorhizobium sp. M7A.F.Ca.ET.027.03.2.1]